MQTRQRDVAKVRGTLLQLLVMNTQCVSKYYLPGTLAIVIDYELCYKYIQRWEGSVISGR
jgi:hypothetical protein